ncbi:MAG: hypothetical protein HC763_05310 [Hydrococcus sp. CRU_1_1]|nr:hypothetical protein [Hydrococcus sp. CRU_1_1]
MLNPFTSEVKEIGRSGYQNNKIANPQSLAQETRTNKLALGKIKKILALLMYG